jgi:outer membrane protein assembly factor BamB
MWRDPDAWEYLVDDRHVDPLTESDPRTVGVYRLLARLGGGGMGQVYLGSSDDGRLVAVKLVRAELAADAVFRKRFSREVAAARSVSALYTAAVVSADADAPVPWLATRYIDGPSLAKRVVDGGPLSVAAVLTLAAGLAEALAAMHRAKLVHRDLKPGNVLLTDAGPHIIDFGISLAADSTRLTSQSVVGTPGFLAPERLEGDPGTPAGDVFSLGATLVFAATGHTIVRNGTMEEQAARLARGRYELSDVPAALLPLIVRCVARNPRSRPTAEDLTRTLLDSGVAKPLPGWFAVPDPDAGGVGGDSAGIRFGRRMVRRRVLVYGGLVGVGVSAAGGAAGIAGWVRGRPAAGRPAVAASLSPADNPGRLLWSLPATGRRPIVVGGSLVVSTLDDKVVAQDTSGHQVWSVPFDRPANVLWNDSVAVWSSGADSRVSVVALSTGVRRFDLALSNVVWVEPTPDALFVIGSDGITAIDRSGRQVWRRDEPAMAPTVAANGSVLVYGRRQGDPKERLVGLDCRTSAVRWSRRDPPEFGGGGPLVSARIAGDGVFLSYQQGLCALDAATGRLRWEIPFVAPEQIRAMSERGAVVEDFETKGRLMICRAADGSGIQVLMGMERPVCAFGPDGQTLYATAGGPLLALELRRGESRWSVELPKDPLYTRPQSLAVDDRAAYVAFGNGSGATSLYALSLH